MKLPKSNSIKNIQIIEQRMRFSGKYSGCVSCSKNIYFDQLIQGVARGCAKGTRAHPLEKKWLEGSTGLKNDPQDRPVFPLEGTLPPPPLENSWLRS
jgi:hypothetical protein